MPLHIHTTKKPLPPRILLYGGPGIGKSTWAANVPGCLMIPVEEGADALDVAKSDPPESWTDFMDMLDQIYEDPQGYTALAIDSVTRLQELCFDCVMAESGVNSIEKAGGGYGKGYIRAAELWRGMLDRLTDIHQKMVIILIGHSSTVKHEDPRVPAFDRMIPHLQVNGKGQGIGPMTIQWCDAVLCAAYQVFATEDETRGGRNLGVGDGERVVYTQERPAYVAKNRYDLDPEMPLDAPAVIDAIKAFYRPASSAA